jgi:type IV pilus assembly protein PilV
MLMVRPMMSGAKPLNVQSGVMLIEALVGVLIFSIGILALIGLQAVAIREVTEAKFRSDASLVADQVAGQLAANGVASLGPAAGTYNASSNGTHPFAKAVTDPQTGLPNGSLVVAVAGNRVTITVTWSTPRGTSTFTQTSDLVD